MLHDFIEKINGLCEGGSPGLRTPGMRVLTDKSLDSFPLLGIFSPGKNSTCLLGNPCMPYNSAVEWRTETISVAEPVVAGLSQWVNVSRK